MLHGTTWQIILQQSCAQELSISRCSDTLCNFFTILFDKILYQLQIIFTMIRQTTSSAHVVSSNIAMYMYLALENSWCFVTPPVVSPQTNMTSEEWLQKFHTLMTGNYADLGSASDWLCCEGILLQPIRSTTQIWEASLHQYGISVVIPQMLFFLLGNQQWLPHKMLAVFSA